jgi:hypothetical protein
MTEIESEKGDVAEPSLNASGALYSNRIIPRAAELATGLAGAGETTIIFHETGGNELAFGPPEYSRSNAIICEATRILESWGYIAATIRKSRIPFDLIAMRPNDTLVIEVVRSRRPVPDAPALCEFFTKEVRYLQSMKISSHYRKMIWVYSPQCRWRFYDVFPGGVWLAKDLMESDRK